MHQPPPAERANGAAETARPASRAAYLLLVVPLTGTLVPPVYNRHDPSLIGIPFFYWYLLLWVPITVVCLAIVSRSTGDDTDG